MAHQSSIQSTSSTLKFVTVSFDSVGSPEKGEKALCIKNANDFIKLLSEKGGFTANEVEEYFPELLAIFLGKNKIDNKIDTLEELDKKLREGHIQSVEVPQKDDRQGLAYFAKLVEYTRKSSRNEYLGPLQKAFAIDDGRFRPSTHFALRPSFRQAGDAYLGRILDQLPASINFVNAKGNPDFLTELRRIPIRDFLVDTFVRAISLGYKVIFTEFKDANGFMHFVLADP